VGGVIIYTYIYIHIHRERRERDKERDTEIHICIPTKRVPLIGRCWRGRGCMGETTT
jgi:hypothetical protein